MTIAQLASKIAKLENKKHQASIGDIREILKCIAKIESADGGALEAIKAQSVKKEKK